MGGGGWPNSDQRKLGCVELVLTKLRNETAKQRFRDGVFRRTMFRVLDTCANGGVVTIGLIVLQLPLEVVQESFIC